MRFSKKHHPVTLLLIAVYFMGCEVIGFALPGSLPSRTPPDDTAKVSVIVEDSITLHKIEGASVTLIHASHEYKAKARRSLEGTSCMDDYSTIFETPACEPIVTYRTSIRCVDCGQEIGTNGRPYPKPFDVRVRVEAQGYETAEKIESLNGGSWWFVTIRLNRTTGTPR